MKSVKNPEVGTLWIGLGMEGGGANGARQAWEGDTFQVAPMAWIGDLGISIINRRDCVGDFMLTLVSDGKDLWTYLVGRPNKSKNVASP